MICYECVWSPEMKGVSVCVYVWGYFKSCYYLQVGEQNKTQV